MKLFGTIALVMTLSVLAIGQTPAVIIATPEEQKEIAPLRDEEKKAVEDLNSAIAKLPEAEAYRKALAALNVAVEKLPESKAKTAVSNKLADAVYRLMARKQLSSREYEPKINDKSEIEFHRKETP